MNSIEHYHLGITRRCVPRRPLHVPVHGRVQHVTILSANAQDVDAAVAAGQPAGCVLPYSAADADDDGNELRVAFDFDGVLAGDSAERNFRRMQQEDPDNALEQYAEYEREHADQPIEAAAQTTARRHQHPAGSRRPQHNGRQAVAASVSSHRAQRPGTQACRPDTRAMGTHRDEAFFLGGLDKTEVLNKFSPHIFFDDQLSNLSARSLHIPAVHIPFGVTNGRNDS